MKKFLKNPGNLLILGILVLTNCADVPSDLLEDAQGNKYTYCVYDYERVCLAGPFTNKSCNGALSNECPYEVVGTVCGDYWYDETNSSLRCQNNTIETLCGSNWYNAADASLRCNSNVVQVKCGDNWYGYDEANKKCQSEVLIRCGSGDEWFDATNTNLRCSGSRVQAPCGENWYNIANQRCGASNIIETFCGTTWDVENDDFGCYSDVWMTRCGAFWYDAADANLRCDYRVIETRCGANWYDTTNTNLKCQNNALEVKCGDGWYDPYSNYCVDGAASTVKGEFTDIRNDITYKYVTIISHTWMAENLNYETEIDSWCPNDDESRCVSPHGRYYSWAAAMDLDTSCNSISCSDQIQPKHKGICPSNWHIPTEDEWRELVNFVGGYSAGGRHLKAKESWEEDWQGEDTYGFAASLSGGSGSNGVSWWSASEISNSAWFMWVFNGGVVVSYSDNHYSRKIRCVKDTE
jgi:uncharacterized protein (TIGR02145 family)